MLAIRECDSLIWIGVAPWPAVESNRLSWRCFLPLLLLLLVVQESRGVVLARRAAQLSLH